MRTEGLAAFRMDATPCVQLCCFIEHIASTSHKSNHLCSSLRRDGPIASAQR